MSALGDTVVVVASASNTVFFIPLVFCMIVAFMTVWRIQRRCEQMAHTNHRSTLFLHFSLLQQYVKAGLIAFALLSMGIALLRPQWGVQQESIVRQGRDLLIALDISRSMLAQDHVPNRSDYTKAKIKTLVTALEAERVGLLIFSGAAVIQCPLTSDHQAFCMFLDSVTVESISSGTTCYAAAFNKILESFVSLPVDRTKLVALCTDGEDFSDNSSGLQAKLADSGVRMCTFGIGTPEGAPIPLYDEQGIQRGFQKDEQGNVVISRRNDNVMQAIAQATGGIYVPATSDDQDIARITTWVKGFDATKWEEHDHQRFQDTYYYFTGLAFVALLLEWIV